MLAYLGLCAVWLVGTAKVTTILLAAEVALPKSRTPASHRLREGTYFALSALSTAVVTLAFGKALHAMGAKPLLSIDLAQAMRPHGLVLRLLWLVVAGIIGGAVGDLAFYAWHRFQHRFLWPIHAVHHSVEDLSVLGNYHHVSDELIRTVLVALPYALLLDIRSGPILAALGGLHGGFIHSCTKLHFGPFRYIVADNRFHRIHHSTDPAHWNKNFCAFFPLWDVIFGTAYFPKPDEWPATGLVGQGPVKGLGDFLARPFTYPGRRSAPEAAE